MVENLTPFAFVVLLAQAIGFSTPVTRTCAIVCFGARLTYARIHISGCGMFKARTVAFSVAWAAFITFAIVLLRHTT